MRLIIATHAKFAEGIVSAAKLIGGGKMEITYINSYVDGHDIEQDLKKALQNEDLEYLVMTDLFGGSVNQECMKYLKSRKMHLVAGVNLPFVLEALIKNSTGCLDSNMLSEMIRESRKQLVLVNDFINQEVADDFV